MGYEVRFVSQGYTIRAFGEKRQADSQAHWLSLANNKEHLVCPTTSGGWVVVEVTPEGSPGRVYDAAGYIPPQAGRDFLNLGESHVE